MIRLFCLVRLPRRALARYSASVFTNRRHCGTQKKRSYFHNPGSEPLRQLTIGELLDETASKWPDRPALISFHEGKRLTYSEANLMAKKFAAGLVELGLKPGDRLAILGPNTLQWYITMLAAAKAGLIVVNINPAFLTRELEFCLRKVGVSAIVMEETFRSQNYYSMLCSIAPEIKKTNGKELKIASLPDMKHLIIVTNKILLGAHKFTDVLESTSSLNKVDALSEIIQPDDACSIQFSSGTTGHPKAALLTHFTIVNNSYFFGKRLGYHRKHHYLCLQVPLFHTFGSTLGVLSCINHGVSMVLPSPTFSSKLTIEALKKIRCSIIYGTPTMYIDLCTLINESVEHDEELKNSIDGFDIIVSGGAQCTPELFSKIAKTLNCTQVASAYGMTETSPIMVQSTENDTYEQRVTTVGCVAEHAEVKVVDRNGCMVPMGTPGEVWFRSYATMLGYWGEEEKTKEVLTPCRWMKSGDLFILHENGYGQVVGRIKDVIIRGGENVFPAEIEDILAGHPEIIEAQVYGVSDNRLGEEVSANIKLTPHSKLTKEDVFSFCRGKLSHFKIPRYIKFVDNFPKTESGKVKKYVLREIMENEKDQYFVHQR